MTPGPWKLNRDGVTVYAANGGEMCVACTSATDSPDGALAPILRRGEQRANARAIAALPDLLVACEAALFRLDVLYLQGVSKRHDTDPLVIHLRAAIAKAKGGK